MQGEVQKERYQIKLSPNKENTAVNMHLRNCLSAENAARLTAVQRGFQEGKKLIVWRCISRLEHGRRYCPDSPTIKEENLHRGIIRAINNYYSCRDDIVRILKANIGSVLECQEQEEIPSIEKRLKEIDQARTDLVGLIASGGCDEDKLDGEFAKLYAEEQVK